MSDFNIEKMAETIDNLSMCLDIMLCCKDADGGEDMLNACKQLDDLVMSFDDQINILNEALTKENTALESSFQRQLKELKMIEKRCNHMIVNIPLHIYPIDEHELHQYNQQYKMEDKGRFSLHNMTNITMSPVPKWNDSNSPAETALHYTSTSNGTVISTTMTGQTSKPKSTKQVPEIPLLKSVDNNEMDSVPKYMKGRLTSLNVNVVIDSINVALENKYEILRKSRNALKKKDQDIYNTWKIQQNNAGQGQYFVTADDITRFSETKVDKTTLNIIPILRHLKRLKESRIGRFVYYSPY